MKSPTKRVVLLGLEGALAGELRNALSHHSLNVQTDSYSEIGDWLSPAKRDSAELIFCPFSSNLRSLLDAVSAAASSTPVVVVSRFPDVSDWLDALEAGASDYCASPFEPRQLNWILQSNIARQAAQSA